MSEFSNQDVANPTTTETNIKDSMSIRDFVKARQLKVLPQVKHSVNGVPYLSFIDGTKPRSESGLNIYFSRKAGEVVDLSEGTVPDAAFFSKLQFVLVSYDDEREDQWKLSRIGGGSYVDMDDLLG